MTGVEFSPYSLCFLYKQKFNVIFDRMKFSPMKRNIVYLFLILAGLAWYFMQPPNDENLELESDTSIEVPSLTPNRENHSDDISLLTREDKVIEHLRNYDRLPDYYITKGEARQKGWIARKGNLCDILPGKAIGGDRFGNREGLLPEAPGRTYYEADINYDCGHRTADRIVFSDDGLIFTTYDHYQSFHPINE